MRRIGFILFIIIFTIVTRAEESVYNASFSLVLQDILETLVEQNPDLDVESIEEDLREINRSPINLNTATASDLERLPFLSLQQVDALLLYCYQHPMKSIYELNMLYCFKDYEIRNLLPFVYVGEVEKKDGRTVKDLFEHSGHEIVIRTDVRKMESFSGDPLYASLKYKMNAGNKVLFGLTTKRDPGEVMTSKSRYGAYLQLNDIWKFKTIIAGDYRASFGLGLVVNTSQPFGKSAYATRLGITQQGLRKYSGTSSDFMRGVGATMRFGNCDVTAFYSCRQPDTLFRQTAGLNVTYQKNRLRIGATAVEYWTKDSIPYRHMYYNGNFFHGTRQTSVGLYAQYAFNKVTLMGEVATAENSAWGWAALLGARYNPVQDVSLIGLLRHYSPYYDAVHAASFSESSHPNDEQGVYVGTEVSRVKNWKFSAYTDFFRFSGPKYLIRDYPSFGYDIFAQADYIRAERLIVKWRARVKHKGSMDSYTFRWQMVNNWGDFSLHTQTDFSAVKKTDEKVTFGGSVSEQFEYHPTDVPFVLQARVEGFYVPQWDNRIYAYENDVLYAFTIPATYGIGARYYANIRWKINEHFSLYGKISDTWYAQKWAVERSMTKNHSTDLHLLLRITY